MPTDLNSEPRLSITRDDWAVACVSILAGVVAGTFWVTWFPAF
jgi:hypothetical protein